MEGAAVVGKEGERGKIPSFSTAKFTELEKEVKAAQAEGKFLLIADLTGKANSFFTYAGGCQYFGLHGENKKAIIQKTQTVADAAEKFRKTMVGAMQSGNNLIVDVDTMIVPLSTDYA